MNPEEQDLYAEMRAKVRGDQERAAKRAEQRAQPTPEPEPVTTPEPAPPVAEEPKPVSGLRRFFAGRHGPT